MSNRKLALCLALPLLAALAVFAGSARLHEGSLPGTTAGELQVAQLPLEPDDALTIALGNGEKLVLPADKLPALEAYLDEQEDRHTELARMQAELLDLPASDGEKYVALGYGCGNKRCRTMLIRLNGEDIAGVPLADDAVLVDYKAAPDRTKAVFRFGAPEGAPVIRHRLVPVDLKTMTPVACDGSGEADRCALYVDAATVPIEHYDWEEGNRLLVRAARVEATDYASLLRWFASDPRPTVESELRLSGSDMPELISDPN